MRNFVPFLSQNDTWDPSLGVLPIKARGGTGGGGRDELRWTWRERWSYWTWRSGKERRQGRRYEERNQGYGGRDGAMNERKVGSTTAELSR